MSHFVVGVIIPSDVKNIEQHIETVLAPYDENIEVEPHRETCICVGHDARVRAREEADRLYGTWADLRSSFVGLPTGTLPTEDSAGELAARWQRHIAARVEGEEKLLLEQEVLDQAAPDCEECGGSGYYESTYNPRSKWDWYVVGGRWDGAIRGTPRESDDGGFNFGDEHHQLDFNTNTVIEVLKADWFPWAIVTPDGNWHEKGNMGWFAVSSNNREKETWESQVRGLYKENANCVIVAVDCHI